MIAKVLRSALFLGLFGCLAPAPVAPENAPREPVGAATLVESVPADTTLDHASIPNAPDVWLEMIDGAKDSLDLAEFYVSDAPGSRLHEIILAILRAADRGVHVRFLIEQIFYAKYPEPIDTLAQHRNVEVRHFDLHASMGGILHAKYFVVDHREAFVGSQNFDYRSLEHIQEIGVRLRDDSLAWWLSALFSADWDVAGGAPHSRYGYLTAGSREARVAGAKVVLGASPEGYLPSAGAWDLPMLVDRIDAAHKTIDVQVLTYKPAMRDGAPFFDLDRALRRAQARGVRVRLLVSSWGKADAGLRALASALTPPSEVRVITIPAGRFADIPFARVAHAKYAVFDGEESWVGTSNWEGDYFLRSRNVSVFVSGASFARELEGVFEGGFTGAYSSPL